MIIRLVTDKSAREFMDSLHYIRHGSSSSNDVYNVDIQTIEEFKKFRAVCEILSIGNVWHYYSYIILEDIWRRLIGGDVVPSISSD